MKELQWRRQGAPPRRETGLFWPHVPRYQAADALPHVETLVADVLSIAEVKARSIRGAKWLLVTNIIGGPASYFISLLLGKTGPEALGSYALVQVFMGVITTFVVFGGRAVLSNFVPKVPTAELRGKMIWAYSAMLLVLMVGVLVLFRVFPSWLEFLLQKPFDLGYYGIFCLFALAVVLNEVLIGVVSGLMHLKTVALTRMAARLTALPFIAVLFFFRRDLLREYAFQIVLGLILVSLLVSILANWVQIWRDPRFKATLGWHLPPGFMAFCWTVHLATLFSFVTQNADRLFALNLGGLAGLGKYQAVLTLEHIILCVPLVLGGTLVPMFSSLLAAKQNKAIRRAFGMVQRVSVVLITLAALPMIAFSRELLTFMGRDRGDYSDYYYLLSLFCATLVFNSPFLGNVTVLASFERNRFRLAASTAQIAIQLLGTVFLVGTFGVLAIAGARIAGMIIIQSVIIYYITRRLNMGFHMPREYFVGVAVTFVATALRIAVIPPGWLGSTLLAVGSLVVFCLLARLGPAEVRRMIELLVQRGRGQGRPPAGPTDAAGPPAPGAS